MQSVITDNRETPETANGGGGTNNPTLYLYVEKLKNLIFYAEGAAKVSALN